MKKLLLVILVSFLSMTVNLSAQTNKTTVLTKSVRNSFPHFTIGITGGGIFPLPKILNQTFKPGGSFDADFGVRINKEVGIYLKGEYDYMASKISGAPVGNYFEFTAGPRYYFTYRKLKSQLFFEGGVGAYYFKQNSYLDPNDPQQRTVDQISNVRPGINGGIGATLYLSQAIDFLVKSKYNLVFTPNGSSSFVTVGGGLEFRFK